MPAPAFVVSHRRTGAAALNVVTAALDVDARTEGTDVVFAKSRDEMIAALRTHFLFGVPEETEEDRHASVALAERLVALGAKIHNHAFLPLPGTPLKNARPSPIEPRVAKSLSVLESRGDLYGNWRQQLVRGTELVRQREAARAERARGGRS
jgi:hypothetical protein